MSAEGEDPLALQKTITKLLEKAGHDPRLTPRILREKAEQRMTLEKGGLKEKREKIKEIICAWWDRKTSSKDEEENKGLKAMIRLARVSGNIPWAIKGLGDRPLKADEKAAVIRERLREKGLVFADVPTEADIALAEKDYLRRKDMDGIDSTLILSASKKRHSSDPVPVKVEVKVKSENSEVKAEGEVKGEGVAKRAKIEYSDEEAEAEF